MELTEETLNEWSDPTLLQELLSDVNITQENGLTWENFNPSGQVIPQQKLNAPIPEFNNQISDVYGDLDFEESSYSIPVLLEAHLLPDCANSPSNSDKIFSSLQIFDSSSTFSSYSSCSTLEEFPPPLSCDVPNSYVVNQELLNPPESTDTFQTSILYGFLNDDNESLDAEIIKVNNNL